MSHREIIFLIGGAVVAAWVGLLAMVFVAPPLSNRGVIICSAIDGNTARDIEIRGPHFDKIPTDVLITRLLNGVCFAREIAIRESAKR